MKVIITRKGCAKGKAIPLIWWPKSPEHNEFITDTHLHIPNPPPFWSRFAGPVKERKSIMLVTSISTGNGNYNEYVELRRPATREGMLLVASFNGTGVQTLVTKEQAKILRDELSRYVDDPEER